MVQPAPQVRDSPYPLWDGYGDGNGDGDGASIKNPEDTNLIFFLGTERAPVDGVWNNDPPPRTETIMGGKMDETTKTGMLISSKSSRVCSNRGGLIRKYGVWNIYIWIYASYGTLGIVWLTGTSFLVLDEHLQTVLPWEGSGHRFRQGSFFTRFHEDLGFQNMEENKAAEVCRHLTTSYFHLYSTVKKVPFPLSSFFLDPFVFTMSVTCSALW